MTTGNTPEALPANPVELVYVCAICVQDFQPVNGKPFKDEDTRAYYCSSCTDRLFSKRTGTTYLYVLTKLGEKHFYDVTLNDEEKQQLDELYSRVWTISGTSLNPIKKLAHSRMNAITGRDALRKFYTSKASYNLKRVVALDTACIYSGSIKWGYRHLWGRSLARLMSEAPFKAEYLAAALKNPGWTASNIENVILSGLPLPTVKFLSLLPEQFATEEVMLRGLQHLVYLPAGESEPFYSRVKEVFGLESTLPKDWVDKLLL